MNRGPQISLDRSSPVPLYFQIASQLESAILSGALPAGERIDNEVALAGTLGLSRPTVRQAIQVLVDKGLVVRKRGVGTQVVHGKVQRSVELTSLYDDLAEAGQDPRTQVLSLEQVAAGQVATGVDVAHELRIDPGDPVWSLHRLRLIGDEPLALMHNVLPVRLIALDQVDLAEVGLYAAMRSAGIWVRVAKQRIGARRADHREARLLGERRGGPLLTMQRTAYDDAGSAVELGDHAYRPDLYAFELTLVDR